MYSHWNTLQLWIWNIFLTLDMLQRLLSLFLFANTFSTALEFKDLLSRCSAFKITSSGFADRPQSLKFHYTNHFMSTILLCSFDLSNCHVGWLTSFFVSPPDSCPCVLLIHCIESSWFYSMCCSKASCCLEAVSKFVSDPEQYKKIYPEQQLLPGEGFSQSTRYRDSAADVNINSQTDDEGQCVQDMRDFNVRTLHFPPGELQWQWTLSVDNTEQFCTIKAKKKFVRCKDLVIKQQPHQYVAYSLF